MDIIRYNKKKNREVFFCWMLITILITMTYSIELLNGYISVAYLCACIVFSWMPLFLCYGLSMILGTDNMNIKYAVTTGYLAFYMFIQFTTQRISTWTYIIPMASILILYNDKLLIQLIYGISIIINIIQITINYMDGTEFQITYADIEIQILCLVLTAFFTVRACKLLSYGNTKLIKLNEEIAKDELTSTYNRYFLTAYIEDKFKGDKDVEGEKMKSRKKGKKKEQQVDSKESKECSDISLAVLDIDSFKTVNDSYGHRFGDLVLKRLASIMMKTVDNLVDTHVVRLGGDEFIIISSTLNKDEMYDVCKECCDQISGAKLTYGDMDVKFHVSIGIANTRVDNVDNYMDLYTKADSYLYKAKHNGKNSIMKE